MKKCILLFSLTIVIGISVPKTSFSQNWLWGTQGTNNWEASAVAADVNGNAYIAGGVIGFISFQGVNLNSPDVDSYLVKYDSLGNVQWAVQSISNSLYSALWANGVAADNKGHEYITGTFHDTVNFGPYTLVSVPAPASGLFPGPVFLAKYDDNGNILWAKQATTPSAKSYGEGGAIAIDKAGDAYVVGSFQDSITFGSFMLTGAGIFIVKYDSNGNVLWARNPIPVAPYGGYGAAQSVTVDNTGNIYATGWYAGFVTFGTDTLTDVTTYTPNIFLVKYDPNGNVLWARQGDLGLSSNNSGEGCGVVADNAGNAYITGYINNTVIFGTHTLNGGPCDFFLVKYASNGNVLWAKQSTHSGGSVIWQGYSLAIDKFCNLYLAAGDHYVTNPVNGKVSFGTDTFTYTNNEPDPALVLKTDSSGEVLCGSITVTGGDDGNGIASDYSGKHIYLGGDIDDTVVFGKDTLYKTNAEPPFVARWQPCANPVYESVNEVQTPDITATLFPNPNNGQFQLRINNYPIGIHSDELGSTTTIDIYNMLGEKVYSQQWTIENGQLTMDLSNYPNGIYLYRISNETGTLVSDGKFIIQK